MSFDVTSWVFKQQIPSNGKFVLLVLAEYAHDDGSNAYPRLSTLARKTGYSERQVRRILGELLRLGILEVQEEAYGHRPTMYRIMMNEPVAVSRNEFSTRGASSEFRFEIIQAFASRCHFCQKKGNEVHGADGEKWRVLKLVSTRQGGSWSPENVVLSCYTCSNLSEGGHLVRGDTLSGQGGHLVTRGGTPGTSSPYIEPFKETIEDKYCPDAECDDAPQLGPQPSLSLFTEAATAPLPSKPKTSRQRNLHWDALLEGCGLDPQATYTKTQLGAFARALKDIKVFEPSPQDILDVCEGYKKVFSNVAITPNAIAKNWHTVIANYARIQKGSQKNSVGTDNKEAGLQYLEQKKRNA
jgi:hypothetical protein